MALYFFDIVDSSASQRDDIGTECADIEEVCKQARRTLPEVARDEIPADGERRFFTVVARNEDGQAVYVATLAYSGMRLDERP